MMPANGGSATARPTVSILGGTTGPLGSGRIGAQVDPTGEATIFVDLDGGGSNLHVVVAGDLFPLRGQLYRVVSALASGSVGGPPGSGGVVVIESEPVTVQGVSLRPDGLVLTAQGFLYLGPGKSQLSALTITGSTATFKVGTRTGIDKGTTETRPGATVAIDGINYRVSQLWPADKKVGITGWLELHADPG